MPISESELISAIVADNVECIEKYIKKDGNINMQFRNSRKTILHYAVVREHNDMKIANFLLSFDSIDLEIRDKYVYTPFLCASKCGNSKACELLLNAGADYTVKTNEGKGAVELFSASSASIFIERFKELINEHEYRRQAAMSDTKENTLRQRNLPVNMPLSTETKRDNNITTQNHHVGFWLGLKQTFFFSGTATKPHDFESAVPLLKKVK